MHWTRSSKLTLVGFTLIIQSYVFSAKASDDFVLVASIEDRAVDYVDTNQAYAVPTYTRLWAEARCEWLKLLSHRDPDTLEDDYVVECEGGPLAHQLRFRVEHTGNEIQVRGLTMLDANFRSVQVSSSELIGNVSAERFQAINERFGEQFGVPGYKDDDDCDDIGEKSARHLVDPRPYANPQLTERYLVEVANVVGPFLLDSTLAPRGLGSTDASEGYKVSTVDLERDTGILVFYNNYAYGRLESAESSILTSATTGGGTRCSGQIYQYLDVTQGKRPYNGGYGDCCGHIIAFQLGGSGSYAAGAPNADHINLFAQDAGINNGAYKSMENKVATFLRGGCSAKMTWAWDYNGADIRPSVYIAQVVNWSTGSRVCVNLFAQTFGVPYGDPDVIYWYSN